jgi:hypothetical protein
MKPMVRSRPMAMRLTRVTPGRRLGFMVPPLGGIAGKPAGLKSLVGVGASRPAGQLASGQAFGTFNSRRPRWGLIRTKH